MTDVPVALRLVRVRVPLRQRWRSAHGEGRERESVLVGWRSAEGAEGWGECPTLSTPGYATETTEVAWRALVGRIAPAVLAGRAPLPAGGLAATAAVLDAALDARLRVEGCSLAAKLGAVRRAVPVGEVVARAGSPPGEVAAGAAAAVAAGAALVKVKVVPAGAADSLRAVREAVGERVALAADANGSFPTPAEVVAFDAAVAELGLTYLEQPLPVATPWQELAALRRRVAVPIALDESLTSPDAVRDAVRTGAVDVVSVKPARLGGLVAAALAVATCREHGVDAFVGGMFELGVGRAGAAAVAALDGCTLPTDLGPSQRYVDRDVTDPIVTDDHGRLVVPDGPGIGRVPIEERLSEVAVEDVVLSG